MSLDFKFYPKCSRCGKDVKVSLTYDDELHVDPCDCSPFDDIHMKLQLFNSIRDAVKIIIYKDEV